LAEITHYKNHVMSWYYSGVLWYATPVDKRTRVKIDGEPVGAGITRQKALLDYENEKAKMKRRLKRRKTNPEEDSDE